MDYTITLLPRVYRINDDSTKQLKRFIEGFDEVLSEIKSRTAYFNDIVNLEKCDVKYFAYIAALLGIELNEALLDNNIRKLLSNIVYIYKRKGTTWGVKTFVECYIGWTAAVVEDTTTSIKVYVDNVAYTADPYKSTKYNLIYAFIPDFIPFHTTFTIDTTVSL